MGDENPKKTTRAKKIMMWLAEQIGEELFRQYVWPFLQALCTRIWALLKAVAAFLRHLWAAGKMHVSGGAVKAAALKCGWKLAMMAAAA